LAAEPGVGPALAARQRDPEELQRVEIAIASGKGGSGTTTVAASLAVTLARQKRPVQLLDCDVETPNAHVFLRPAIERCEAVTVPMPLVDQSQCTHCEACARLCQFEAIACSNGDVLVFAERCPSCGGCALVCPERVISEEPREIGSIEEGRAGGIAFAHGQLHSGQARAAPLIAQLRSRALPDAVVLIDAPSGTSRLTVEAVRGSSFVCLVTEPTPFGLRSLDPAVQAVRELNLPMGVVVNRAGAGDDRIRQYCAREEITILTELPHDRRVAEAGSRGEVVVEAVAEYQQRFAGLWQGVEAAVPQAAREESPWPRRNP
jgi:MinD superfamily P-loop ATPase